MDPNAKIPLERIVGQNYGYMVWAYSIRHSLLLVQAQRDLDGHEEAVFLVFEAVVYWEGPVVCEGTFHMGTSDECLQLLRGIRGVSEVPEDYLTAKFRLFEIKTSGLQVRIVAENANAYEPGDITPISAWWPTPADGTVSP